MLPSAGHQRALVHSRLGSWEVWLTLITEDSDFTPTFGPQIPG